MTQEQPKKKPDPRYLQLRVRGLEIVLVIEGVEFMLRTDCGSAEGQESFRDSVGVLRRALKLAEKSKPYDDLPFSVFIREG